MSLYNSATETEATARRLSVPRLGAVLVALALSVPLAGCASSPASFVPVHQACAAALNQVLWGMAESELRIRCCCSAPVLLTGSR